MYISYRFVSTHPLYVPMLGHTNIFQYNLADIINGRAV